MWEGLWQHGKGQKAMLLGSGQFLVWLPYIHLFLFLAPVSFSPIASSTLINLELLFEIWLVTQARRAGP